MATGQRGGRGCGHDLAVHTGVFMCMHVRFFTVRVKSRDEKKGVEERISSLFCILAPTPQMLGMNSSLEQS